MTYHIVLTQYIILIAGNLKLLGKNAFFDDFLPEMKVNKMLIIKCSNLSNHLYKKSNLVPNLLHTSMKE